MLLAGAGLLTLSDASTQWLLRMQEDAVQEVTRSQVLALAEQTLTYRVRTAAEEIAMFLEYSDLDRTEFMDDEDFRAVANSRSRWKL